MAYAASACLPRETWHASTHSASFETLDNAEFKKFVDTAHYHPSDDLNFLKEWERMATIPKDGDSP